MDKEEFLKQEGVYQRDDVIWTHLSPIPNWVYLINGLDFTCPFCGTKRGFTYKAGLNKDGNYGERSVVFVCECGQKFGLENYDHYYGD